MTDLTGDQRLAGLLKRALGELRQTRAELHAARMSQDEPIAIVGMACKFPGQIESSANLWSAVRDGRCVIGPFPRDRGWDIDAIYDPDSSRPGTTYTRSGGFVEDATSFDPDLFGISPREALAMDPQQRLLLETSWRLFEDAGVNPDSLRDTPTGVFVGLIAQQYGLSAGALSGGDPDQDGYLFTGSTPSVASGRIAYSFGLRGPAITVDTACSSSLLAIHLACRSLRQDECELALAGGATILPTPTAFIEFSRQRALAPDGRCKAFAASADGTAWGEGAGLLLLQRLPNAQRAGRKILAVIRGSAINQDGASNGLTAPNGLAQREVILRALTDAGLSPAEVDAVEAHGTGTSLGDPIEAEALLATYGAGRVPDQPMWLGSVKSNLGHTAAAAGVAGVIKMVEAIRHGVLPPTLHVDHPSRHVNWSSGTVSLLTERRDWPVTGRPRRGGVSAFGISGTNAHLILEQAPAVSDAGPVDDATCPWDGAIAAIPLSAKGESRLRVFARRMRESLDATTDVGPHDVAGTYALTRPRLDTRAVIVAADVDELKTATSALADGRVAPQVTGPATVGGNKPLTVFVFPGQGGQYVGMARGLYRTCSPFRGYLDACADALAPHVGWSLTDVLLAPGQAELLERDDVVQPALFGVMVALAKLWQHLGVQPDVVLGHSQGEIAAACVSGALSLEDAALVVARRSRALTVLAGRGGTMTVTLAADAAEARLTPWLGRLSVGAINGPASTVISGDRDALLEFSRSCEADGVEVHLIAIDYAAHSAHVDEVVGRLRDELAELRPREAEIPFCSTVTAGLLASVNLDAAYWCRNLRETVRFEPAVRQLLSDGYAVFLESSPHPILSMSIEQIVERSGNKIERFLTTGTLRRDRDDSREFLSAAARLDVHGVSVRWDRLHDRKRTRGIALPGYPFKRQRLWLGPGGPDVAGVESRGLNDVRTAGLDAAGHPLLTAAVELPDGGVVFTGRISVRSQPWLADHAVGGLWLFPGTAFVDLALHAGGYLDSRRVEELTLETALPVPAESEIDLRVAVEAADDDGRRAITIHSRRRDVAAADWTRHATGCLGSGSGSGAVSSGADPWPPSGHPLDVTALYQDLAHRGYDYGPTFRGVRAGWRYDEGVLAEVALPDSDEAVGFGLHPALLDGALHAAAWVLPADEEGDTQVPFVFRGVSCHRRGAAEARVCVTPSAADGPISLSMTDTDGRPLVTVDAVVMCPTSARRLIDDPTADLYQLVWTALPSAETTTSAPDARIAALRNPAEPTAGPVIPMPAAPIFADPSAAAEALDQREPAWDLVLYSLPDEPTGPGIAQRTAEICTAITALLQSWVREPQLTGTRLVILTRGAIAAQPGEHPTDLAAAAVWGLVRAVQLEEPGRIAILDFPHGSLQFEPEVLVQAWRALRDGIAQAAVRGGSVLVPSTVRAPAGLTIPDTRAWRLSAEDDGLRLVECPDAEAPLTAGRARVRVRAAGVNFRDVLESVGAVHTGAPLGDEIAGTVVEVGPGVVDFTVGDQVMGLGSGAFGPVVVTDSRLLAPLPSDLSFTAAAGIPVAYLTAYYTLVDVGAIRRGDRVLIHAATGGVGLAALQLARRLGAEVYATASPGKWHVLRSTGLDDDHIGSSRTLDFEDRFRVSLGGAGFDVVLNSLAGEFTDASLRLLRAGGSFVELGKTDVRDAVEIAARHPGVRYRVVDLHDAGVPRLAELLRTICADLKAGLIPLLSVTAWDIRRAPEAFGHMGKGRHTGKVVLTIPNQVDPDGTVLITGGTGALGGIVARHFVRVRGARRVILAGRSGADSERARRTEAELGALGATVTVIACDLADAKQSQQLLAGVPERHRLTAIVHCAGLLDDAVLAGLTPDKMARVLRPKVDAAWNLHCLTRHLDLAEFTVFSSLAGTMGNAGQANYGAANAFLDALAQFRAAAGLPALSIAWGLWSAASAMADQADRAAAARRGILPISNERGMDLYEAATSHGGPAVIAARLDLTRLPMAAADPILRGFATKAGVTTVATTTGAESAFLARLHAVPHEERGHLVLSLIREQAAEVLGHVDAEVIRPEIPFRDQSFDSLTSVELRNRLGRVTQLMLPSTVAFDHPTPADLAEHLLRKIAGRHFADVASRAQPSSEPVAIIGLAGRYPGGVSSGDDLWRLVRSGTDAITAFPTDRGWDLTSLYHPDPASRGTSYTRHGGFLTDAGAFDAAFFGISPVEATAMDPQQRLLLEIAWEAFEHAFIDPRGLRGAKVGVFTGVVAQNYAALATAAGLEGYVLTGNAPSVASGRLAYLLGLEGPAITVDTACSSSLVALHLAVQSLRRGECSLALAGGAAVMPVPDLFVEFSRQRGLAPDGRCKAFAADADGTAWGEGAGQIVLERLSDAQRNGHRVLAVIRGSAVNQDGASNGLTAPNGSAQRKVIGQALLDAGLGPTDIDAVEAHGTGTVLGDPIEAQALLATYGAGRSAERPLWLGSVKSNIGHTQAASGVTGVIKMVEAIAHEVLPRTLHVDEPTPHVDWSQGTIAPLVEEMKWPQTGRPRRAAVSSFGISGTNAHVILEQAPAADPQPPPTETGPIAWPVSAASEEALRAQASRLFDQLVDNPGMSVASVAQTLVRRTSFSHRAVVVGASHDALVAGLDALAQRRSAPGLLKRQSSSVPRTVFVFSGQGSQWRGMAASLFEDSEVFRNRVLECDEAFRPHIEHLVVDTLRGQPLKDDGVIQPALFTVMVALAELWRWHGVQPDAVIGHSQGEIAAACVAGGLTVADGARIVAARVRLLRSLSGRGAMAVIALPVDETRTWIEGRAVQVAAVNGPSSTVVSGDRRDIEEIMSECRAAGLRVDLVPIGYASHSPQIDDIRDALRGALADLSPRPSRIPFYSTVTGGPVDTSMLDGDYWFRNLREPVAFDRTIGRLIGDGFGLFIEQSPHPVLTAAIEDHAEQNGRGVTALGTLRRHDGGPTRFLKALADAYVRGVAVRWHPPPAQPVDLPTYPFQRRTFWAQAGPFPIRPGSSARLGQAHPLLPELVEPADGCEVILSGTVSLRSHAWLAGHEILGDVLMPGAVFADMALCAAQRVGRMGVDDLVIEAPLRLAEDDGTQLQVIVRSSEPGTRSAADIGIYARPVADPSAAWRRHATGRAVTGASPSDFPAAWPPAEGEPVEIGGLYRDLAALGFRYTSAFAAVRAAWRLGSDFFAELELPEAVDADGFSLHPALLDAALHVAAAGSGERRVPFCWSGVRRYGSAGPKVRAMVTRCADGTLAVTIADPSGMPVLAVGALTTRPLTDEPSTPARSSESLLQLAWTGTDLPPTSEAEEYVLIASGQRGLPGWVKAPVFAELHHLRQTLDTATPTSVLLIVDPESPGNQASATHAVTQHILSTLQEWLADDRLRSSRLTLLTTDSVAAVPGDRARGLAGAAIWGLVRSAQNEHPGCFAIVDSDDTEASRIALLPALSTDEPQLVLRAGTAYRPVLSPLVGIPDTATAIPRHGTVLLTGGTGGIGRHIARRLSERHRVGHIRLLARREPPAPIIASLQAELAEYGTEISVSACDVSDRRALADVLAGLSGDRALTAVVHCAGIVDDAVLTSLDHRALAGVLRPKVDGAWNLHELTENMDIAAFVLFSSAAGALGSPGQANYAAANAFLDALAHYRRARGRPAHSIAWGVWNGVGGMADRVEEPERLSVARRVLGTLTPDQGYELFDRALALGHPAPIALGLDLDAVRRGGEALPRVLRRLVSHPEHSPRGPDEEPGVGDLISLSPQDRRGLFLELIRSYMIDSLGYSTQDQLPEDAAFPDMGFSSLNATELRNHLKTKTGLQLSIEAIFNHATPGELADHLEQLLMATLADNRR